ncbi:3-hydroxy-3-methylglutaryl-coenzyme A reductase [Aulographum hederae CBS 113979]|uniref:3-hydroxy-3-methylglutaryl coenzyme A reductase n=1 Tax=Aulographum hederae CBS 113979 TaxID=1176131 RepID=A0A6G1GP54_9PEZI|nr:3-hydroxy-3-methylglutaryl-coenzyme A reductase [Aulographum hederae CBS 113979]
MLGASFLPRRLRGSDGTQPSGRPSWYNRQITPLLQSLSSRACTHPIHTIVFVALIASTTYIGLLEGSLFDTGASTAIGIGRADYSTLENGSKRLRVGEETGWRWQIEDESTRNTLGKAPRELSLLTFVFPDSTSTAPSASNVPVPSNSSAQLLPCSSNMLSPISQDTTIAYGVRSAEVHDFLSTVQEIPTTADASASRAIDDEGTLEEKKWIMKAAKSTANSQTTLQGRAYDAWSAFLDLLKNAESLDIVIMVLGYLSMHLTFVSLFLSMRRLGSNFWLATTVMFSSVFAFLFGLSATSRLGVPINMVLLSEGLPFLVVTIGFEKPIILTKAVLSASLDSRRQEVREGNGDAKPFTIHHAVQAAVKERGYEIVRDYCVEILILVAGAASGVQGGLRQFCFLAAWILFFDCILLFTFYTAILTIKLEINRIKRHVALRKALEDDGVSRTVAENVASSNEWPKLSLTEAEDGSLTKSTERSIFGRKIRDSSIPKFKVLMVTGFIVINVVNLCTIPFRGARSSASPAISGLSSVVTQPPIDPFKVAANGLDAILKDAKRQKQSTVVTVFSPIKYELEYPSIHYATPKQLLDVEYGDQIMDGMGGRVVDGILKSLEDPILSKWIIVALAMSLVLNGYLFNAARWSIKDPRPDKEPPRENEVMDGMPPTPTVSQTPAANPQPPRPDVVVDLVDTPSPESSSSRTREECEQMLKDKKAKQLNDKELIDLSLRGKLPGYALEKTLEDKVRAVKIRRAVVSRTAATRDTSTLLETSKLPYENYNYDLVHGACCENVIGYLPLPVGVAGPLMIDGQNYFLPMATTEGVLVASTSRGCKAINAAGGTVTVLTGDGMTRGPCVGFETLARAGAAKVWLDSEVGQRTMKTAFNSTSRYARLQSMKTSIAGTYLYIRFKTTTGDAMGMNMISKGVEHALHVMSTEAGFEDMATISVSGNFCTDKKPSAINWIDGRGKSVVAEAIIPGDVVRTVLKSNVDALVELNIAKNLIGSSMAGSIGGNNAHAANIVTAIFLATGQDPAQNVESSNCMTIMKNLNGALQISVSMPCIEVGTIGGGTILEPQSAMLDLLGVRGAHPTNPGDNARQLARIVAAGVLAGELSLCSALAAGHLVQAHMSHNRSQVPTRSSTPAPTGAAQQSAGSSGAPPQAVRDGTMTPVSLAMTEMRAAGSGGRTAGGR